MKEDPRHTDESSGAVNDGIARGRASSGRKVLAEDLIASGVKAGQAMTQVGYSRWSARKPGEHRLSGATPILNSMSRRADLTMSRSEKLDQLADEVVERGLKLKEGESPDAAQMALAIQYKRHRAEHGATETNDLQPSHRIKARWSQERVMLLGFLAGLRAGARAPDVVTAIAEVRARYEDAKNSYAYQASVALAREIAAEGHMVPGGRV